MWQSLSKIALYVSQQYGNHIWMCLKVVNMLLLNPSNKNCLFLIFLLYFRDGWAGYFFGQILDIGLIIHTGYLVSRILLDIRHIPIRKLHFFCAIPYHALGAQIPSSLTLFLISL